MRYDFFASLYINLSSTPRGIVCAVTDIGQTRCSNIILLHVSWSRVIAERTYTGNLEAVAAVSLRGGLLRVQQIQQSYFKRICVRRQRWWGDDMCTRFLT